MGEGQEASSPGFMAQLTSWLTSLAGITTALATIATSVSGVLGYVVHHQAAQLSQAQATVSRQAQQIQRLQASARVQAPASSAPSSPAAVDPAAPIGSVSHYLSDLTPTVDNALVSPGDQVIAAQSYPKSISFYCDGGNGDQPGEAFDVAGSRTFTAEAGIPDNMQDVTGVIATITFSNEAGQQIGKPVQVSLGHPVKLTLGIGGVTQLGITCTGRDARTSQPASSNFQIALGDAGVS